MHLAEQHRWIDILSERPLEYQKWSDHYSYCNIIKLTPPRIEIDITTYMLLASYPTIEIDTFVATPGPHRHRL